MKLIGDEHISPRIITVIRDLALSRRDGWTMDSASAHYAGSEDEDWISAFARTGGQGIISADREMLKRPTLISQISDTGLIGVYVQGGWANADRVRQAAHILYWWPTIERAFTTVPLGSAWIVPQGFNEKKGLRECKPFGRSIQEQRSSLS